MATTAQIQTGPPAADPKSSPLLVRLAPTLMGALISIAVCFPWIGSGRLLLLDWLGPSTPLIPPQAYGLRGGLVSGLAFTVVVNLASHVFGHFTNVLPALVFFPIAATGMARLVPTGLAGKLPAALLYAVNPFVFDRLYVGQFGLLLGYAFLPFALASLMAPKQRGWRSIPGLALWWTLLIACSPHFVWIFGVAMLVWFFIHLRNRDTLIRLALATVAAAISTSYVLFAASAGGIGVKVGLADLRAYRTLGDPHFGLFVNVLGLYGFWRKGPELAKDVVTGWPIILLGILIIAVVGYGGGWRERGADPVQARRALLLVGAGIVSLILAMGDQGPFGSLFRLAYQHVPFFAIMREPEKFLSLYAVALAFGFGLGVDRFCRQKPKASAVFLVAVALAIPIGYEPIIFGGLNGQVSLSSYPASWRAAKQVVAKREGSLLVLPWHLYVSFPFTGHRVIANPAQTYFAGEVIQGDNVQLPGLQTESTSTRSSFIAYAIANASLTRSFGELMAPLGVQYIALLKTADWASYGWLGTQSDLTLVYSSRSVNIYRNSAYRGLGYSASSLTSVPNWGSVISLAQQGSLSGRVIQAAHLAPGAVVPPVLTSDTAKSYGAAVTRTGPTSYRIAGKPGTWFSLAEAYQPGWSLKGVGGIQLTEGNLGWRLGGSPATVSFSPAGWAVAGELFSLAWILLLIAAQLAGRRRIA